MCYLYYNNYIGVYNLHFNRGHLCSISSNSLGVTGSAVQALLEKIPNLLTIVLVPYVYTKSVDSTSGDHRFRIQFLVIECRSHDSDRP